MRRQKARTLAKLLDPTDVAASTGADVGSGSGEDRVGELELQLKLQTMVESQELDAKLILEAVEELRAGAIDAMAEHRDEIDARARSIDLAEASIHDVVAALEFFEVQLQTRQQQSNTHARAGCHPWSGCTTSVLAGFACIGQGEG
jgi:hypothetical protein